jgi:uncharacterized glyoxalase superfamily protein PhnB
VPGIHDDHEPGPGVAPPSRGSLRRALTLQVEDARAEFERLKGGGLEIAYPLHDEPWGQRRFAVYDPSGAWVDVIQQIDPAPGFWEKYPP